MSVAFLHADYLLHGLAPLRASEHNYTANMGDDDSNNSAPSSLPDKSPSSTTGTTDNGRIKRSRATNACEACKKRKAKVKRLSSIDTAY